jgi:hypothetical protein
MKIISDSTMMKRDILKNERKVLKATGLRATNQRALVLVRISVKSATCSG